MRVRGFFFERVAPVVVVVEQWELRGGQPDGRELSIRIAGYRLGLVEGKNNKV